MAASWRFGRGLAAALAGLTLALAPMAAQARGPGALAGEPAGAALPPLEAEIVVTLEAAPGEVWVGVPFTVGFALQPADGGFTPLVVAQQPGTGQVARAAAQPAQGRGHYAARLILPAAGAWEWAVLPFGAEAQAVPVGQLVAGSPHAAEPAPPEAWLWAGLIAAASAPAVMLCLLVRRLRHNR